MRAPDTPIGSAVAWHDAECGAYRADLSLWERLADACGGPVLELGAGTGRVALALADRGHRVVAVDSDPELLVALDARAGERGLPVETVRAEVPDLGGLGPFALVAAPMQFVQLLSPAARRRLLRWLGSGLSPGGRFAAALLDHAVPLVSGSVAPLPDVREVDGWVHSSLPLELEVSTAGVEVRRLRQLVSPSGDLREQRNVVRLRRLAPDRLEREGSEAGLRPAGRLSVAETEDHVASLVVTMERRR